MVLLRYQRGTELLKQSTPSACLPHPLMFAFCISLVESILLNQHTINCFINYIRLQVDNKLSSQHSSLPTSNSRSDSPQPAVLANWTFPQTGKINYLFYCQMFNCLTVRYHLPTKFTIRPKYLKTTELSSIHLWQGRDLDHFYIFWFVP